MSRSSDPNFRSVKLSILMRVEGFSDENALIESCLSDSVCPAICMSLTCDHVAELEPDQSRGYCEACGGTTMQSALVLAGVV